MSSTEKNNIWFETGSDVARNLKLVMGQIKNAYPSIDNVKYYNLKSLNHRLSKSFLISYSFSDENYMDIKNKIEKFTLRCYKEKCKFKDKDAFRIIIADIDINIEDILPLLR